MVSNFDLDMILFYFLKNVLVVGWGNFDPSDFALAHGLKCNFHKFLQLRVRHIKLIYLFYFLKKINKLTIIIPSFSGVINEVIFFNTSSKLWCTRAHYILQHASILCWGYIDRVSQTLIVNIFKIEKFMLRSSIFQRNKVFKSLLFKTFLSFKHILKL